MEKHRARPLYRELASAIQARKNCAEKKPVSVPIPDANGIATGFAPSDEMVNPEWFEKWTETIERLTDLLPHGSGIDSGCQIDLDKSHAEKLVIHTSFHHMDESGGYDGWTEHTITVTPSFSGINLRISGPNRNDIKEYLYDTFDYALSEDVAYYVYLPTFPEYKVSHRWIDQCQQEFSVCENPGIETNEMLFRNFKSPQEAQSFAADLMEAKSYSKW